MTRYDPDEPTARVSAHEIEVPGDPTEVWRAIATGPGIATWFVPAEVEEREGGRIITDHGPFGTSEGVVTVWEPPHRFAYEERGWNPDASDAPPWATELLVEARDGGTCIVRLVSGFFEHGDDWEQQLEGTDEGWRAALRNLRLALTHFPGQTATSMAVIGTVTDRSPRDVAHGMLSTLGLEGADHGDQVQLHVDTPPTAGCVVGVEPSAVTLLVQEPYHGILELATFSHEGATVMVRGYLFGDGGDGIAARETSRWTAWLGAHVDGFTALA